MERMSLPKWLKHLLSTTFFSECEIHTKVYKNECNKYCLDCRDQAYCSHCIRSSHKDHQVIQIRKSSYHECVKVTEIQKALDIGWVQQYVINSAKVIFLNRRTRNEPQAKNAGRNSGKNNTQCEICQRNLVDPYCFCSMECKLAWIKMKEIERFVLSAKEEEEMKRMPEEMPRILPSKGKGKEMREGILKQEYQSMISPRPPPAPQACSNSRKRKGIPQRAPFF